MLPLPVRVILTGYPPEDSLNQGMFHGLVLATINSHHQSGDLVYESRFGEGDSQGAKRLNAAKVKWKRGNVAIGRRSRPHNPAMQGGEPARRD